MSVPTEFHSTLYRTYHTLCISVRQPITEVKAEWNVAADVWEIGFVGEVNWLLSVTVNGISVRNVTVHRCAIGLKKV